MLAPRWRKVLADLLGNKVRTILTVLSIAVGVMAVGAISTAYVILQRDMDPSFRAIHPAGAILSTSPFETDFLDSLRRLPGMGRVEGRAHVAGFKLERPGDSPLNMELRANPDFEKSQLDRLILRQGGWPENREIVLEHLALATHRGPRGRHGAGHAAQRKAA